MTSHTKPPLLAILLALTVSACADRSDAQTDATLLENARTIHEETLTIDTHVDISFDFATGKDDPGVRDGRQVTLPKMREGGLDAVFWIVYVGQEKRTPENYAEAKRKALIKFEAIHRMAEDLYPEETEIAYSAADFERIHASGKLVAAIGIENGFVIGRDLSLIAQYHDLGARYMTLTHAGHNDIGDSATPDDAEQEEEHGGLSDFGEQVVREMNRVGMMVDVSHVSKNTMLDATRISRAPVFASHSGVYALRDSPRNLDDEQLLALAENGGVIQLVALSSYVKAVPLEVRKARQALLDEAGIETRNDFLALSPEEQEVLTAGLDEIWRDSRATVADYVNHIDYAVDLIGIDHVGIGSDFDGGGGIEGWSDASETLNVTAELVKRGYSREEIRKIWGGNMLRLLREVEHVAATGQ